MATKLQTSSGIFTYTGRVINPLDPDPRDIDIRDIAHALSNQCRFTGHTKEFYSVAQHSVLVSQHCDPSDAEWGLLHDATEAYLSDIARPIKQADGLGEIYKEVEDRLHAAVAEHFGLSWEIPKSVKIADTLLLRTEMRDLMHESVCRSEDLDEDLQKLVPLPQKIIPWNPRQAHGEFMIRFMEVL